MKKARKSRKQLNQKHELKIEAKRKEFEAEYYQDKELSDKLGLDLWELYGSLEEFFEFKLNEWESEHPKIVIGKYQDREKRVVCYHEKFIEFIRQCRPQVIEELREFVPYFDKLFAGDRYKYDYFFDRKKVILRINQIFKITKNTIKMLQDNLFVQDEHFSFLKDFNNPRIKQPIDWNIDNITTNILTKNKPSYLIETTKGKLTKLLQVALKNRESNFVGFIELSKHTTVRRRLLESVV